MIEDIEDLISYIEADINVQSRMVDYYSSKYCESLYYCGAKSQAEESVRLLVKVKERLEKILNRGKKNV